MSRFAEGRGPAGHPRPAGPSRVAPRGARDDDGHVDPVAEPRPRGRGHTLGVILAAVLAGALARALGLPAAWLVGPLLAAAVCGMTLGWRVAVPARWHRAAQAVVGMAVSASFPAGAADPLLDHWPAIAATALATLLLSVAGGLGLARAVAVDPATALLGTLSGGASGMVAMSDDLGADARVVAFPSCSRPTWCGSW